MCFDREAEYLQGGKFRFEEPWSEERRRTILGTDEQVPGRSSVPKRDQTAFSFGADESTPVPTLHVAARSVGRR
jgi:hypothetical protein